LESFFIDAGSGKLIKKEKWATTGRTWTDDRLDGLNRIIPLGQDRFAVVISRSIETFDMRFRPLKVYALDPPPTKWAVQAVNDGAELAIRHESVRPYSVRFSWFSADSLQPIGGFKDLDLKMLGDRLPVTVFCSSVGREVSDNSE
jgi:hypothetical protein